MILAIDIETNSEALEGNLTNVWCIAFHGDKGHRELHTDAYWSNPEDFEAYREVLQKIIDQNEVVFHNATFDKWALEQFFGVKIKNYHCTMVMSYVEFPDRPNGHSLAMWGQRLGLYKGEHNDFSAYSDEMGRYCQQDAKICYEMYQVLVSILPPGYNIDRNFLDPLIELNQVGVEVDVDKFAVINEEIKTELHKIEEEIYNLVPLAPAGKTKTVNPRKEYLPNDPSEWVEGGYINVGIEEEGTKYINQKIERFNPGSGDQISWALTSLYGWKPDKLSDKTGKPTVDRGVLVELDYPLARLLVQFSEINKLATTYGDSLLAKVKDGRLYANYNHCVTKTGRLSSSSPNMQNIPSRGEVGGQIRSLFKAAKGYKLVGIDIDQFQMRILAWYLAQYLDSSEAWALWNDFSHSEAADPHGVTARLLFGDDYTKDQRKKAKTVNFGFLFGIGVAKMATQLGCTIPEAKKLIDLMNEKFSALSELKSAVIELARANDGDVYTLYGRRGRYPALLKGTKQEMASAERQAFNFIIQGTEADIMKMMETEVYRFIEEEGLSASFVIQCHDEFVFEVIEEEAEELRLLMNHIINYYDWLPGLPVTGKATIGDNWMEIH